MPARPTPITLSVLSALMTLGANPTRAQSTEPARSTGVVVITGSQPSSLPTRIPTTIEGTTGAQIEQAINASDSEDALKYLPSLLVRKRYIGDYNHAVLSTRASGTGNSARSLVYADGVLLSNLLGNGATFTPRWGMVAPEQIDRVDVLYGPFSAAYPGNSVGAVVDYVTRMPSRLEAHVKLGASVQPNDLYGQRRTYHAGQASASIGSRQGAFSWFVDANHTDSVGQPLVFGNKLLSAGAALRGGEVATTGALVDQNPRNQPWALIGTSTQYDTVQDHLKARLAWDLSPGLRASWLLGLWQNAADGQSASWLRDANGQLVDNTTSGDITQAVNINGKRYTLSASDFPKTRDDLLHVMQALSLKTRGDAPVQWSLSASQYDYQKDLQRAYAPTARAQPQAGRITDQQGTGWLTLAAKGSWRSGGASAAEAIHVLEGGIGQDRYALCTRVDSTNDWRHGDPLALASRFEGNSATQNLWGQHTWQLAPGWASVLGLRAEHWRAWGGLTQTTAARLDHPERTATHWSPKAALSHELGGDWVVKASTGRAIRYPTVSELYQGGFNNLGQAINTNPDLRPERSQTSELSAEWVDAKASLRITLFHEDTRDALYSQLNTATNNNTVQNIDQVRTSGLELAASSRGGWTDALLRGLQLQGSLTYADSRTVANSGYLLVPGDTIGKWQPRVPRWRASALANWQATPQWSVAYGVRYSGRQFSTLDNGDPNGFAYTGASAYITSDLRVRYAVNRQWSVAVGIDNLNNYQYWNFHPYPQRSLHAELKFDL